MSVLFKWGRLNGGLPETNPAAEIPKFRRPKHLPKANRRWTAEELDIVLAALPPELRLAAVLAVCTGMRQGDVLRFPWSGYRDGKIQGRAAKTGTPIWMPAHPMLAELLAKAPRLSPTIVVGARGKPYSQPGFRARFWRVLSELRAAGKIGDGLTFHGLRTTCATMLHEAGCDTQTIMAVTGHQTEAMVRTYTEEADRAGRATAAIAKLDFRRGANKERT